MLRRSAAVAVSPHCIPTPDVRGAAKSDVTIHESNPRVCIATSDRLALVIGRRRQ
jgi:hypothetical protein